MPFRFRFKSLLRHRQFLLREAQNELARAKHRQMQIQEQIRQTQACMAEQWRQWEEKQKEGMVAFQFLSFYEYIDSLERQLHTMKGELERAAIETDKRKEVMIDRDKAVKMLENLKETDKEAYRYFEAWGEQKQMDELAIFKDFRDRNTSGSE